MSMSMSMSLRMFIIQMEQTRKEITDSCKAVMAICTLWMMLAMRRRVDPMMLLILCRRVALMLLILCRRVAAVMMLTLFRTSALIVGITRWNHLAAMVRKRGLVLTVVYVP